MRAPGVLEVHRRSQPAASQPGAAAAPCLGCGEPTTTRYGGRPLHPTCDITPTTAPAPAAVPVKPTAPSAPVSPVPDHRPTSRSQTTTKPAQGRRPTGRTESPWHYSAVVIDPAGIYLPDGTVAAPEKISTIADVA